MNVSVSKDQRIFSFVQMSFYFFPNKGEMKIINSFSSDVINMVQFHPIISSDSIRVAISLFNAVGN